MFSKDPVSSILKKDYVEARLHTDLTEAHEAFVKHDKRIQEVRTKYLGEGNLALPYYFVFDPKDLDNPIATHGGKSGMAFFKQFFEGALAQAGKSGG